MLMANILGWLPLSDRETVNLCRDIGTLPFGFSSSLLILTGPHLALA